jgi:hypothetical protein
VAAQPPATPIPVAKAPTPPPVVTETPVAPVDAAKQAAQTALAKTGISQNDKETTVTLIWHNENDLNIQVKCPKGKLVKINKPGCGAHVDFDDNGSGSGGYNLVKKPVEHLTWGSATMSRGRYTLYVEHFNNPAETAGDDTDFTVVFQQGATYKELKGRSRYLERVQVMTFDVP